MVVILPIPDPRTLNADIMGITSSQSDPGAFGRTQEQLPPLDHGPIDLHSFFGFPRNLPRNLPPKPNAERSEASDQSRDTASREVASAGRPLELEIGSGKGTFLAQQAARSPEIDYLGVEYARAYYRYAADRARRNNLDNVRLLHAEAGLFIRNYVADATFRQVHIYFPDPWPKKRHHKRRFVQEKNLRELARILAPPDQADPRAGCIRIATDHAEYFQWMQEHAAKVADLFERLPFDPPDSAGAGELVGTNFERKYRREGRGFHGMVLRKR